MTVTEKNQRFTRQVRMYRGGYLSVCVYLNVLKDGRKFYDTVVYRKIKVDGKSQYQRGTNLKPDDLPILIELLGEASEFIQSKN